MKTPKKMCPDCRAEMKRQHVEQEFVKEGTRVLVSGIPGWRCPKCGAIAYPPGTMDHVVRSARELFALAKGGAGFLRANLGKR